MADNSNKVPSIDPRKIPLFTVFRCPHVFEDFTAPGASRRIEKQMVLIGFSVGHLLCLKPTSKVKKYENDPEQAAGVVSYPMGTTSIFAKDTAIDPANVVMIPFSYVEHYKKQGVWRVLGVLDDGFKVKILLAIENSITMSQRDKDDLLKHLQVDNVEVEAS